jgi:hypothetical protein
MAAQGCIGGHVAAVVGTIAVRMTPDAHIATITGGADLVVCMR